MTSPFLFPSCHEAVTWKSFQGSVFFVPYRQIFIVQESGMRTKHWWQGPWKVELHSIFFQWFMFSTQQPPAFQTRQVSSSLLLYVETASCALLFPLFFLPTTHAYSVAFCLARIVFLFHNIWSVTSNHCPFSELFSGLHMSTGPHLKKKYLLPLLAWWQLLNVRAKNIVRPGIMYLE